MNPYSSTAGAGWKRHLTRRNLKNLWIGANGLRAGWAILLFAALVAAGLTGLMAAMHHLFPPPHGPRVMTLRPMIVGVCGMAFIGLCATKIMSLIDGRSWLDYGLRSPRRFILFIQGAGLGIVSISALIAALYGVHAIHLERSAAAIGSVATSGLEWAMIFIVVGFNEEIIFRGYPFFRLLRGTRPLIATVITALAFGAGHLSNSGESALGILSVFGYGLLLCLLIWRTGSLWLAIGFHAAVDWGETFLFGVADSGGGSSVHWLSGQPIGPVWLSGGTVGPEGSALVFPVLALTALLAMRCLPVRQYDRA